MILVNDLIPLLKNLMVIHDPALDSGNLKFGDDRDGLALNIFLFK